MRPTPDDYLAAIENTWPAAACRTLGPWILRDGQGGGKRVSAATANGPVSAQEVTAAEKAMHDCGQVPLFMIRRDDKSLDILLAESGYEIVDPVRIFSIPVDKLTAAIPPVTTFTVWEPLAIQREIWASGGIGSERVAVMERTAVPKTALFARSNGRPAATGFVAVHKRIAMVHALEVQNNHRRQGLGRYLMQQAAIWSAGHGATHVAALCTYVNAGSNALFNSLGMSIVEEYHYRQKG